MKANWKKKDNKTWTAEAPVTFWGVRSLTLRKINGGFFVFDGKAQVAYCGDLKSEANAWLKERIA